jgi:hypothetical protein
MLPVLDRHQSLAAADPSCGRTVLIETWRSPADQDGDFARGRDASGKVVDRRLVVTAKRGGESWHNLERWARRCPDCPHELGTHILSPSGPAELLCCSAPATGGLSCPCAITARRLEEASEWARVPASLAYHIALLCQGCHASGSIVGFGSHGSLYVEDVSRIKRLGQHGADLGLRCGMDWDGDRVQMERGENDLYHFEYRGAPLSQVVAALSMRGGELRWPPEVTA